MCKLDLKDAYFTVPLHGRSQKFIHFQFQGRTSIHLSPIWTVISPTNFQQVTQTSNRDSKENGYLDDSLSGRYAHNEQHLRRCQGRHLNSEIYSRELRISDKHGRIHIHPCTGHRIPGSHRGLHKHDVSPPKCESRCNPEGKQTSSFSKSAI